MLTDIMWAAVTAGTTATEENDDRMSTFNNHHSHLSCIGNKNHHTPHRHDRLKSSLSFRYHDKKRHCTTSSAGSSTRHHFLANLFGNGAAEIGMHSAPRKRKDNDEDR